MQYRSLPASVYSGKHSNLPSVSPLYALYMSHPQSGIILSFFKDPDRDFNSRPVSRKALPISLPDFPSCFLAFSLSFTLRTQYSPPFPRRLAKREEELVRFCRSAKKRGTVQPQAFVLYFHVQRQPCKADWTVPSVFLFGFSIRLFYLDDLCRFSQRRISIRKG